MQAQLHFVQQMLKEKQHEISMLVREHESMVTRSKKVQNLLTMIVKGWGGEVRIEKDKQALTPNLEVKLTRDGEDIVLKLIEHEMTEEPNGTERDGGGEAEAGDSPREVG